MNCKKRNIKNYVMFLFINLFVLSIGAIIIICLCGQQEDIVRKQIPLYNNLGEVINERGVYRSDYVEGNYWFSEEVGHLKGGVYTINFDYQTNYNGFLLECGGHGKRYRNIYIEDAVLNPADNIMTLKFWINGQGIDSFNFMINCGEPTNQAEGIYLYLSNFRIVRDLRGTLCYRFLKLTALVIIFNFIFFCYIKRQYIQKNFYIIAGLGVIFIVSSLGLCMESQIRGHDLLFHWGRIIGLKKGILAGDIPVRIQPGWFNGYGYPVSVFYGDILLYIPAILYALNVPLVYAYKIYVFLINLGTVLISYYCFSRMFNDKYVGVLCSAIYVLSINRILNIYLRAAVGEFSAAMFFPLIALSMWNIFNSDIKSVKYKHNWLILCIGMTGVIQTHILSVEMTGIFLIVVCLFNIKRVFRRETLLVFTKSIITVLGLNASFLVPFLDFSREKLEVFKEQKIEYGVQRLGLSLYELLSVNSSGVGKATSSVLGLNNRIPISVGFSMTLVMLVAIIIFVKYPKWTSKKEKNRFLMILGFTGIALWSSTYYFPWDYLASFRPFRKLSTVFQFPWRFLTIATVFLTILSGLVISIIKRLVTEKYMKIIIISMYILSAYQALQYMDMTIRNSDSFVNYDGEALLNRSSTLAGEYLYDNTNVSEVLADREIKTENVKILDFDRIENKMQISLITNGKGGIEIPLFAYPNYQCVDSKSGDQFPIVRGYNNKMKIQIPSGYQGTLEIFFQEPWYWRLSEIVSLVTLMLVIVWQFTGISHILGFFRRHDNFELED